MNEAAVLNGQWDSLMSIYDRYYEQLSPTVQNTLKKAVSDWQNFYFGSATYPAEMLAFWRDVHAKASKTLEAATKGVVASGVVNTTAKAKKSAGNAVFEITGRNQYDANKIEFPLPKWWWFALGGLPALAILYLTRKVS